MAREIDGMGYRDWQKRNSEKFGELNKNEQKELRLCGYRNVGWDNVRGAWQLLQGEFAGSTDRVTRQLYGVLNKRLIQKTPSERMAELYAEGRDAEAEVVYQKARRKSDRFWKETAEFVENAWRQRARFEAEFA